MTAAIPLVWSDAHRRHVPSAEIWLGVRTPAVELPARADAIRTELERAGHPVVAATPQPDDALEAVHDRALLDFLAGAWDAWERPAYRTTPASPRSSRTSSPAPGCSARSRPHGRAPSPLIGNARSRAGVSGVMTRAPSVALATVALALAVAAPAGAKELSAARACDADRCNTVTSHGRLGALIDMSPAAAPERRAPFHRVRMTMNDPDGSDVHFTIAYIPALGLVREQPSINGETLWTRPSPRAIRVLEGLTRGLEPVPARRLRGIVGDTAAAPAAPTAPPADGDGDGGGAAWLLVLLAPAVAAVIWAARRRVQHAAMG